jgi:hypothetical protein
VGLYSSDSPDLCVGIQVGLPGLLTVVSHGFPQFLGKNSGIYY